MYIKHIFSTFSVFAITAILAIESQNIDDESRNAIEYMGSQHPIDGSQQLHDALSCWPPYGKSSNL